jgi:hypothetical protein
MILLAEFELGAEIGRAQALNESNVPSAAPAITRADVLDMKIISSS